MTDAVVSSLAVYPLKGARGIDVEHARVDIPGLSTGGVGDREWMAVDANGRFVSQREHPDLCLVGTAIRESTLDLAFPGAPSLSLPLAEAPATTAREVVVWNSRIRGLDAGDVAAGWLSRALRADVRIVRFDPSDHRACQRDYAGDSGAHTRFADGYPILVIGQASLDELNRRLGERGIAPMPMRRFRPNLVVAGLEPHDEDHLDTIEVDGVVLRLVKPCTRCQVTTVDPATGHTGREPLATLAAYRQDERAGGVTFGMNAIVVEGAGRPLAVGGRARCVYRF